MYSKKWVGLFLILIMALGVLSGCSPIEKEYYKLTMEASGQKVYEDSGSMELMSPNCPKIFLKETRF